MSYDATARRQTPLAARIAAEIARDGPMPIDTFMARCLWDEQSGYYATRLPLGRSGDFITAPEISQVFGELIGLWAAVVWRDALGAPSPITLAELGPGRGTLMCDMLRATGRVEGFSRALRCHMIEASKPLIELQRQALADSGITATWGADVGGTAKPAIIVANEFFDALPLRQWVKSASGWAERTVTVDDNGVLGFGHVATSEWTMPIELMLEDAPSGAILETRDTDTVFSALSDGGPLVLLAVDYGHERTAVGDTLQAVRSHRYEHPLTSPGEADLSSHVDFEALANSAKRAGFEALGPVTQAEFLAQLGIIQRTRALMTANPARAGEIEYGTARLVSPEAMGGRFKVMAFCSPGLPKLPGLEF